MCYNKYVHGVHNFKLVQGVRRPLSYPTRLFTEYKSGSYPRANHAKSQ
jgi:hypothetical protein